MDEIPDDLYARAVRLILLLLLLLCRRWCVINSSGARHYRVLVLWKALEQSSDVSRSQSVVLCCGFLRMYGGTYCFTRGHTACYIDAAATAAAAASAAAAATAS